MGGHNGLTKIESEKYFYLFFQEKIFQMEQLISAHEEEINEQKKKVLLAQVANII